MLRKADNNVKIEGILSETDLKYSTYEKNGVTVEAIGGSIKVLVEQEINGASVVNEIPVYMFSNKLKRDGGLNPAYTSIEKVMNEFVSIAACGSKEQADRIRINGAEIRMNEFPGQDGRIVSQPRVNASFIARAVGDFKPHTAYSLEFMVSDIKRVTDFNGMEIDPPKVEVTAIVPQFNGSVQVVKLYATNPNVINAVESYWEPGNCYVANGRLNFTSTVKTFVKEVDFGEPVEESRTVNVNEFIITSGTQAPMDDEMAFSVADIKAAMAERNNRLNDMKTKNVGKNAPAQSAPKGKMDLGF